MKSETKNGLNIALSGWSGAGTTSLTLLLALVFKKKYLYIGQLFRSIEERIGFNKNKSSMSPEYESLIQPQVGRTIDNYVDHKLLNDSDLVIESDLSVFRIGKHPKVYSIFIKADTETRLKRAKKDGRGGKETLITERDEALRKEYMALWDIDIFDQELIARKYNLIIDNTKLSVKDEVIAILERLAEHPKMKAAYNWTQIKNRSEKLVQLYEKKGKEALRKELAERKMIISTETMLTEIVKLFPEDIQTFPQEVQALFLGR